MRRKMRRDPFEGVNEDILGAGAGDELDVPYDRTAEEEPVAPPPAVAPPVEEPPAAGVGTEPPAGMLAGLGAPEGTTDEMSDLDLAGLNEPADMGSPEDLEVEQLEAMLADPSLSPQDRDMIQQQMAIAARRKLAGLGGQL